MFCAAAPVASECDQNDFMSIVDSSDFNISIEPNPSARLRTPVKPSTTTARLMVVTSVGMP
jgi:hypothetical protein